MPGESQKLPITGSADPTVITNERIAAAAAAERDYADGKIAVVAERLRGIDVATELLKTDLEIAVGRVLALIEEKFKTVDTQFTERDERGSLLKKASDDALAAALQAAKELVGVQAQSASDAATKAETSFTKQIDQIGVQIVTGNAALDSRITELKERIDRGEGNAQGTSDQKVATNTSANLLIGVIGVLLTVLILGVALYAATH